MADITTRLTGFKKLSYTLTALPILPYLKLDGIAPDGIQWERAQPASTRLGADGKAAVNQRPVLYTCTVNLLPNSNSRTALDLLISTTTAKYGRSLVDYTVVMTVTNHTAGTKTVYTGGVIEEIDAGDSGNLDEGQSDKAYRFTFVDRTILPL